MIDIGNVHIGDQVMVVPEWTDECHNFLGVNNEMEALCGKVVTITRIDDSDDPDYFFCHIAEDNGKWSWSKWMFDYPFKDMEDVDVATDDFSTILMGRS